MKKVLHFTALMTLLALFLVLTVSCDQPTPKAPSTYDEFMKYANGYVPTGIKPLDEDTKDIAYPIIEKVLNSHDFITEEDEELHFVDFLDSSSSGSWFMKVVEVSGKWGECYNGTFKINGETLELIDFTLVLEDEKGLVYSSGTALLDGKKTDSGTAMDMISTVYYYEDHRETTIKNGSNGDISWCEFLQEIMEEPTTKLYYTEKVDGKTVSFCIDSYFDYNYEGYDPSARSLEYLVVDGVFYETKGVTEAIMEDK